MRLFSLFVVLLLSSLAFSQNEQKIIEFCASDAEFPGGQKKLEQFIKSNLTYPQDAKQNGIQGVVYVEFIVHENGSISDIIIVRGLYPSIDSEAIRLIRKMPDWESAYTSGQGNLKTNVRLPIRFELNN